MTGLETLYFLVVVLWVSTTVSQFRSIEKRLDRAEDQLKILNKFRQREHARVWVKRLEAGIGLGVHDPLYSRFKEEAESFIED